MTQILPSLTSTKKERIADFLRDLRKSPVAFLALFPTTLKPDERRSLYSSLEEFRGLTIPHVHLRSDCDDGEIAYLVNKFGTQVFNVHPSKSHTAFVPTSQTWVKQIYLENADALPLAEELAGFGGICPDFSHWEAAKRARDPEYREFETLVRQFPGRCCHISAIRPADPNPWNGRQDHHYFVTLDDLDYMTDYADFLPPQWASLELENSLADQLDAKEYLSEKLSLR